MKRLKVMRAAVLALLAAQPLSAQDRGANATPMKPEAASSIARGYRLP